MQMQWCDATKMPQRTNARNINIISATLMLLKILEEKVGQLNGVIIFAPQMNYNTHTHHHHFIPVG